MTRHSESLEPVTGDDEHKALLRELIAASDRTTHAVRAIVLPSTIMLVATLVALPFFLIFLVIQVVGFAVFAGLLIFVGAILAISSQISETRLSSAESPTATGASPSPVDASSGKSEKVRAAPMPRPTSEPNSKQLESEKCECSVLERGLGGVETKKGRKTCRRCSKPL